MIIPRRAQISALLHADSSIIHAEAVADGEMASRSVVAYPDLTGPLAVGDTVLLNTTATHLGLGTGGVDFVVAVLSGQTPPVFGAADPAAHIIKLRYAPHQIAVDAVEMSDAYKKAESAHTDLENTPVVVCGLHSQIAPVAAGVKAANPDLSVAYVMSGGAALPLAFSRLVGQLKNAGLIDTTVTAEQSFGGDLEAVSLPSALFAARYVARADVIIVGMGPGNAGTGTRLGFAGVEQGYHTDMALSLNACPVAVLRVSLADTRPRHRFLSHHSETALGDFSSGGATVAFPEKPSENISDADYAALRQTVNASRLAARHSIEIASGAPGMELLERRGVRVSSMGRGAGDDPVFFHAASAAGRIAAQKVPQAEGNPA